MTVAVGTKELTVEKLAEMDSAGLAEALRSSKEELFNLRFQSATGQLESSSRLKDIKRDIARIYTVVRERELGIRENVDAASDSSDSADEQNEKKTED